MKKVVNGVAMDMTSEELELTEQLAKVAQAEEKTRPLTESEINRILIAQQINTIAVDDNTAVRMKAFYPTFECFVGQEIKKDYKFTYGDKLWRVIQPSLTIQAHFAPGVGTESLYEQVNETYDGTIDDPIPYNGNMSLQKGLYYYQSSAIYLCTRDTVNPVYQSLHELVDLYVECV
jgi:hypothetical protein